MIVIVVLGVSLAVFRGLGALGVGIFATWQDSARFALAVMFLFTAGSRLTPLREDLIKMVPKWVPNPRLIVNFTGICEALGAIGLLIPAVKVAAGLGLLALLIAMFPANVNAARQQMLLGGRPATPLLLRLPMQILFIALTAWVTLG